MIGGTGQGQLRVFAKAGLAEGLNRTWELEEAFGEGSAGGVALSAGSFVSVFPRREKCIYRDNLFSDGGPMQLYCELQYKCHFLFGLSIANAEMMENFP